MFEEYTYEKLLEDVLANAPSNIDTRPGSIFYDSVSGILLIIAQLYVDIGMIGELINIDTTSGEFLDKKARDYGVTRLPATSCCYYVTFEGAEPEVGERFYTDGQYFVLRKNQEGTLYLEAETAGTGANGIYSGTAAIPVNNILGLTASTFGELMDPGTDEESDDDLRERIQAKLAGPSENGNKSHYRTWCESIEGVGRARIIPLWNGPNTVKGILITPSGTPAGNAVIKRVQEYIDPDEDGDGEGDGLGEGVANIGAHFTAVAPEKCTINIELDAFIKSGATEQQAISDVTASVTEHLKGLALNTPDDEEIVVRISTIGALISGVSSILDYRNLKINGDTVNIVPGNEAVAVLGEVSVNVL